MIINKGFCIVKKVHQRFPQLSAFWTKPKLAKQHEVKAKCYSDRPPDYLFLILQRFLIENSHLQPLECSGVT